MGLGAAPLFCGFGLYQRAMVLDIVKRFKDGSAIEIELSRRIIWTPRVCLHVGDDGSGGEPSPFEDQLASPRMRGSN
jgi:hypothetical protein